MDLNFLPGQQFECTECGRCCRGWKVGVDRLTWDKVAGSPLAQRLEKEQGRSPLRTEEDGTHTTVLTESGDCSFLTPEQLCSIHSEMGRQAKPRGCRQFPFMIRPTPDGIVVGASFYCPSIQANSGRPLEGYSAEIQALIAEGEYVLVGDRPIEVARGKTLTWAAYRVLEACLSERLTTMEPDEALRMPLWLLGRWVVQDSNEAPAEESDMRRALSFTNDAGEPVPEPNAGVTWFQAFCSVVHIGSMEASEAEQARLLTDALVQGKDVTLQNSGWSGCGADLLAYIDQQVGSRFDADIVRYLQALLYRKYLATDRPLLDNLFKMALLPLLLRFYTGLYGLIRKVETPDRRDFNKALDKTELNLMTHTGSWGRVALFSQSYLSLVEEQEASV